jgi:hypothetical protein
MIRILSRDNTWQAGGHTISMRIVSQMMPCSRNGCERMVSPGCFMHYIDESTDPYCSSECVGTALEYGAPYTPQSFSQNLPPCLSSAGVEEKSIVPTPTIEFTPPPAPPVEVKRGDTKLTSESIPEYKLEISGGNSEHTGIGPSGIEQKFPTFKRG